MSRIRNMLAQILPKKLKDLLVPLFKKPDFDKPSILAIDTIDGFQVAYRKGTADENIIGESFSNDTFFPGVPEYQPDNNHIIIDIGAHIGTFSLLASSKVPKGKVYAIEACQDSFNMLRINVALNQSANISVHHFAIAEKNGNCTLYYSPGNWGHSIVSARSRYGELVESRTLSSFMEDNRINHCHFMKLNCEGAEFPILLSTPGKVLRRIDTILALYHSDLSIGNTEADLISCLQSSGFNTIIRNQSANRGWIIATNTSPMRNDN